MPLYRKFGIKRRGPVLYAVYTEQYKTTKMYTVATL